MKARDVETETPLTEINENVSVFVGDVELSEYQIKIRKHIHRIDSRRQRPHFICPAVAGSGKSWTLKMLVREIKKLYRNASILVCQFNKHIKLETEAEVGHIPGVTVKTNHGTGIAVFALNGIRVDVDDNKYFGICKSLIEKHYGALVGEAAFQLEEQEIKSAPKGKRKKGQRDQESSAKQKRARKIIALTMNLKEMVTMCHNTLTDSTNLSKLRKMISKYEITVTNEGLLPLVDDALDIGIEMYERSKVISFEDMLTYPFIMGMKFPQYDFVLCDECQDFNKAQLELILAHVAEKNGTIGSFGQKEQSIMMWAGSMSDSIDRYIKRTNARILPLSICYRCPAKVVELAQLLVPDMQASPNCIEGEIKAIGPYGIYQEARPGDYILCRLTAPLVKCCIEFIRNGIRAKVKGREIGKTINKIYLGAADEAGDSIKTINQFIGFLGEHRARERQEAIAKKMSQAKLAQQEDYFSCIAAIAEYISGRKDPRTGIAGGLSSHRSIATQISYMFNEAIPADFITLSTVHRAKGLETDNVFIIEFDKMPFKPTNKKKGSNDPDVQLTEEQAPVFTAEAMKQEMNVMYVAITRPKKKLYIQGAGILTYNDIVRHVWTQANIERALRGVPALPEPACLKEIEKAPLTEKLSAQDVINQNELDHYGEFHVDDMAKLSLMHPDID